jgi:hypothetical protein
VNRFALIVGVLLAAGVASALWVRSARDLEVVNVTGMRFRITSVDFAPDDLYGQVPLEGTLMRRMPGSDRPDYWLAALQKPVVWLDGQEERSITHVIVSSRYVGETIDNGFDRLVIGLAYVTDASLLSDQTLTFEKCRYVAIGVAERVVPSA